ncbi:uncharacterized protein PITG_22859 [Phytophthora infestans T30-4]|uniref:Secreted protein n=1 Tax=Phytophthora infestans (strain T30-4) TaxID=403677 RepID=D0ND26_PHYIT|nr:uncharacterized protein PITG_22859 [Phytophthora infestans T30-4]EEY55983.1 conserved hypothetical protein [Phytophthora infestans T30-4]|eukprot:XP_002902813.1 conserved hypothetical protein [Phytophthora infestans T30-4]
MFFSCVNVLLFAGFLVLTRSPLTRMLRTAAILWVFAKKNLLEFTHLPANLVTSFIPTLKSVGIHILWAYGTELWQIAIGNATAQHWHDTCTCTATAQLRGGEHISDDKGIVMGDGQRVERLQRRCVARSSPSVQPGDPRVDITPQTSLRVRKPHH